jgi:hypothetical protein
MSKYEHKEAFCLMQYACNLPTCRHYEVIWNSRDGVTPFSLSCPSCDHLGRGGLGSLTHIHFQQDVCSPDHKLSFGQKFWRDGTKQEAVEIMKKRIAAAGDRISSDEADEIIRRILDGTSPYFEKGWPMLDVYMGDTTPKEDAPR